MIVELTEWDQKVVDEIKTSFPQAVLEAKVQRDSRIIITVKKESILEVARYLKDKMEFDHPASVAAIDYPARKELEVIYHAWSTSKKTLLALKTTLPVAEPHLESLTSIWNGVDFHERETHEMLGVEFAGHPKLVGLLLQEDWTGPPPLRKDFKLRTTFG